MKLKLKEGEGLNTHILESKKDFKVEKLSEENEFRVDLASDGLITHEEHGTIRVKADPKTSLIFCSQLEYDPFLMDFRQVFD